MQLIRFIGIIHMGIAILFMLQELSLLMTNSIILVPSGIFLCFVALLIGLFLGWRLVTKALSQPGRGNRIPFLLPPSYPSKRLFQTIVMAPYWFPILCFGILSLLLEGFSRVSENQEILLFLGMVFGIFFAAIVGSFGYKLIFIQQK